MSASKEIRTVYGNFLKAWETGEGELFEQCLKETPFAYVSMYGHCYDGRTIGQWFRNPGPEGSELHLQPLQQTVAVRDDVAQQYAVILGTISQGQKHITFGGSFMNRYEKIGGEWKLETIRFQLQWDDGMKEETMDEEGIVHRTTGDGDRTLFGEWMGVDERVGAFQDKIEHSGETVITPEIDAPWRIFPQAENGMTDEEAMLDVLCRTSCAYDFLAMSIAVPAFSENALVDIGGLYGPMNRRDALMYVKEMRRGMPRCFSGFAVDDAKVTDTTAAARLQLAADGSEYEVSLAKENGHWMIDKLIRNAK